MNIGFEVEFFSELSKYDLRTWFQTEFDEKLYGLSDTKQSSGKFWQLTEDVSLSDPSIYASGYELVSPVFDYTVDADEYLIKMLAFIKTINGWTNHTTGIHINVDLGHEVNLRETLDPLTLVVLMDEKKNLKKWHRQKNHYCKTHMATINKVCRSLKKKQPFSVISDKLNSSILSNDKYFAIGFTNLHDRGYIEFRTIGGKNYHLKAEDILNDMNDMVDVMIDSCFELKASTVRRKINKKLNWNK